MAGVEHRHEGQLFYLLHKNGSNTSYKCSIYLNPNPNPKYDERRWGVAAGPLLLDCWLILVLKRTSPQPTSYKDLSTTIIYYIICNTQKRSISHICYAI